jgi:hypothetical protein
MRNKEVVLYSFYKNWAYVLVYVYLQFEAGGFHSDYPAAVLVICTRHIPEYPQSTGPVP